MQILAMNFGCFSTLVENANFSNELWLLFSGDKGGSSMKFVFSIINDEKGWICGE